ncbi:MAG: response regulator [Desulfobacterales bacterium]|nr:response regulator [Desulfobacterales bacterium]
MDELKNSNVHILLVEDHPGYLERLERRLKKFGYQQLKSARNAINARKELSDSHFDVIVADMRLEKDDSGGFEIIDIVKELKLSSIVIIFTANDTVIDCRKALKGKGAWDYISKSSYDDDTDPMEELHKSIQEALTYFNQWGNVQDKAWIKDNMGYLLDNYHGNYVAVLNNKVIEAATDKADLEKQIIDKKLPLFLTVIEKIDDELFKQLTAKLIVFVEGPTDVKYIKTAIRIFEKDELFDTIVVDTIGNRIGDQGGGKGGLKNGFNFLKNKRLITAKVLFLADQDVSDNDLPNNGNDFENLYIRRIGGIYSKDEKGIEWLFNEDIFEQGVLKGFAEKTVVNTAVTAGTNTEHKSKTSYKITGKAKFCNWICDQRENSQTDFQGFQNIFQIFDEIIT